MGIGGVALVAVMQEVYLQVRATKDLDVMLIVEALPPAFGQRLWEYIEAGGYEMRQRSDGHPVFYHFRQLADGHCARWSCWRAPQLNSRRRPEVSGLRR